MPADRRPRNVTPRRPQLAPGVEIAVSGGGLEVYGPSRPRPERLDAAAAAVLVLCDGSRTAEQLAQALARGDGAPAVTSGDVASALSRLHRLGAITDQAGGGFDFFDGIFCINLDAETERWAEACRRYRQLGIGERVERFPAVHTPGASHHGAAASHRRIVLTARARGYRQMLVFEDDAVFHDDTPRLIRRVTADLDGLDGWDLCFLGAAVLGQEFPFVAGSSVLQECGPVTCTHALAIHHRAYDRILADIPAGEPEFGAWMEEQKAFDQYLMRAIAAGTFRALIASPRLATQQVLTQYADADLALAGRYTI